MSLKSNNLTTAQKLKSINNQDFELIATAVLHEHNSDYATIIHIGINADSKTKKSPLDGFCLVPGSNPPRFLMVAHTTTSKKDLEQKWLHDHSKVKPRKNGKQRVSKMPSHSDDGDVIKAGHQIKERQQRYPNAIFTIILTTNQELDIDLMNKVYDKAKEYGETVSIDFWDLMRFVYFLDSTPRGQGLRKSYLNIEADQLSEPLFRELCQKSLKLYELDQKFLTSPSLWVQRNLQASKGLDNDPTTVQFIVGGSGFGKSAYAYQTMQKHMDDGGYALWVPEHIIESKFSLEGVFEELLHELYPTLRAGSAEDLFSLIQEIQLLLVIDDVNHSNQAVEIINKFSQWLRVEKQSDDKGLSSINIPVIEKTSNIIALCPVWPQIWETVKTIVEHTWVISIPIGSLSVDLTVEAIQKSLPHIISPIDVNNLARQLSGDPFLIGLFTSGSISQTEVSSFTLSRNVVKHFIHEDILRQIQAKPLDLTLQDYWQSLKQLVHYMLTARILQPQWSNIRDLFGRESIEYQTLEKLGKDSKFCSLDRKLGIFSFRHDRIFEAIAVECFLDEFSNELPNEMIWDPFYAELVGAALAEYPDCSQEFIGLFSKNLPLALAEALKRFRTPASQTHHLIIAELKHWAGYYLHYDSGIRVINWSVVQSFLQTDSPVINDILQMESYHNNYETSCDLARFRNGCVRSGMRQCSRYGLRINSVDFWHLLINHVKYYYKDKLVKELQTILFSPDTNLEDQASALILAGYLGERSLFEASAVCWNQSKEKLKLLGVFLWAFIRCFDQDNVSLLQSFFDDWAAVPDTENSSKDPLGEVVMNPILWPIHDGYSVSDSVVEFLIYQSQQYPQLKLSISNLLRFIDDPKAIEFAIKIIVTQSSDISDGVPETELFVSYWSPGNLKDRRLSTPTIEHLKLMWQEQENNEDVRVLAFRLWLARTDVSHLKILQSISSESILFSDALSARVYFQDRTALEPLLNILQTDARWFQIAQKLWCNEIKGIAGQHLSLLKENTTRDFSGGESDQHFHLSRLLTRIPEKDAEGLLLENWGHLRFSPLFIEVALMIGTPRCLELAKEVLDEVPAEVNVFEFFWTNLQMSGVKVNLTLLQNLKPYARRFDEYGLHAYVRACVEIGQEGIEWMQKNLTIILEERGERKYYAPTLDDLIARLEDLEGDSDSYRARDWLESFEKFNIAADPFDILGKWFRTKPTYGRFTFVATCIEVSGLREHLPILDHPLDRENSWLEEDIRKEVKYIVRRRTL